MFDLSDGMKKIVNDYQINVFEIAFLTEEQVKMFKSDFQSSLFNLEFNRGFIKEFIKEH